MRQSSACPVAVGLVDPQLSFSPDGRFLYAASEEGQTVVTFRRNPRTGALAQAPGGAGCASFSGRGCARGRALDGLGSRIVLPPDGRHLYALSGFGLVAFSRDPVSGALAQLPGGAGCLGNRPAYGCTPVGGPLEFGFHTLYPSPDGRFVYGIGSSSGVSILSRDGASGELRPLPGCMTWEPERAPGCTTIADGSGRSGSLTFAPDGAHAYLSFPPPQSGDAKPVILVLRRDEGTGVLSQLPAPAGCVSQDGAGGCTPARAAGSQFLGSDGGTFLSPDGRNAYYGSSFGSLAVFRRDPGDGSLEQLDGTAGCFKPDATEGCDRMPAAGIGSLFSPDGRHLYRSGTSFPPPPVIARDPATGALSETGVAAGESLSVFSPDGAFAYTFNAGAFARDRATGALTPRRRGNPTALEEPKLLQRSNPVPAVFSPDGRHLYGTDSGAIVLMVRAR